MNAPQNRKDENLRASDGEAASPRDLRGHTASARDTTTTLYGSHRRRAGDEAVTKQLRDFRGSPAGSPGVAQGGPRQATGKGKGGERGSRGERGSQRGKGSGELTQGTGNGDAHSLPV